jgi:hypothetical protein
MIVDNERRTVQAPEVSKSINTVVSALIQSQELSSSLTTDRQQPCVCSYGK